MLQEGAKDVHDPLLGLDIARLEKEMESYHDWFDERTEEAYQIAAKARAKGFDHTLEVEIPRASDLASRTEKLLIHHLEGVEVAADISNFQDLTKGRLAICVQDVNDNVFVMGHTRGVELTGGTLESGVAMGDFNGLKYEFTAEEFIAAPFLAMTTPAVPTGDMVTFTPTAS